MRDLDDQFGPRFRKEEKSNKTCLIVGLILGGAVDVASGELQLANGETFPLFPDDPAD